MDRLHIWNMSRAETVMIRFELRYYESKNNVSSNKLLRNVVNPRLTSIPPNVVIMPIPPPPPQLLVLLKSYASCPYEVDAHVENANR